MTPDLQFRAYRIDRHADGTIVAGFATLALEDLTPGTVIVRVGYSSINYKDALAATGAGRILRRYPLVGGIDLAGTVVASEDAAVRVGDAVLVTGCGLSETRDGGYAEYARVPAEAVVPIPEGLDARAVMALGTAGFSAALAITRLEENGLRPGTGPVAVTGASGGVGSIAIDMLAARGYEVVAVTAKADAVTYLRDLGAREVIAPAALGASDAALLPVRWAGAIDNLGGTALARLAAGTVNQGGVACIGLAESATVTMTVMPLILRGVSLLGVNSAATTRERRLALWRRIGEDLRPRHLDRIAPDAIGFEALPGAFGAFLTGSSRGRTVVRIGG